MRKGLCFLTVPSFAAAASAETWVRIWVTAASPGQSDVAAGGGTGASRLRCYRPAACDIILI